jgi:hypothetical protein
MLQCCEQAGGRQQIRRLEFFQEACHRQTCDGIMSGKFVNVHEAKTRLYQSWPTAKTQRAFPSIVTGHDSRSK